MVDWQANRWGAKAKPPVYPKALAALLFVALAQR
jgi:hypothetical protein